MNTLFIKILISISLFNCSYKSNVEKKAINQEVKKGFLFVKTSLIYRDGGQLEILDKNKNIKITFKDKLVFINGKSFDAIEEDYLLTDLIKSESFYPEYGLFILESNSTNKGFYEVKINDEIHFIDSKKYKSLLSFKTTEQYVLDAYPYLTEKTPLRIAPNDSAKVIENYTKHTYLSLEIKGDWLKIKDDKECYFGPYPSKTDIIGWVKWREKGVIILDIRHRC